MDRPHGGTPRRDRPGGAPVSARYDTTGSGAREPGTTVIVVTHDARVAAYADREIVVSDGQVSTLTGAEGGARTARSGRPTAGP
jgi:ABC-type siderophore export system fused ATPase/permease subunit